MNTCKSSSLAKIWLKMPDPMGVMIGIVTEYSSETNLGGPNSGITVMVTVATSDFLFVTLLS